jgi:hypothetical protein
MLTCLRWDSGVSSSTTTKIIAPAAKQRAQGGIFCFLEKTRPRVPQRSARPIPKPDREKNTFCGSFPRVEQSGQKGLNNRIEPLHELDHLRVSDH